MNEPRRLRDEAESPVELLLLEAGVAYRSSADARAKTLAALGLVGSAAVSAGAISAASSSLVTKVGVGWSKLLLISSLGAGVVAPVGYLTWNRLHSGREESAKVVAAPPTTPPAAVVARTPPAVEAPPTGVSFDELPAPVVKPEAKPSSPAGDLAAELGALDVARSELAAGDANGALAKLDDYSRLYPRGRLVLEAEVLRIDALAKSGQTDVAKKRAEAFLRRHPNSVLASRVRAFLD
ncbi:MAG TPA: hypothetical protein VLJ38_14220 [Polyangiaceae bacterium]|nr:hypothetical protein [Polyangiaceae bacterium]